jgi:hypothetical protein
MRKNSPAPKEVEMFLGTQFSKYALAGYKVIIHPESKIKKGNMTYTGEATANSLEIALGGDWSSWLGILVHETCHLDQHLESSESFDIAEESLARISSWLDGASSYVAVEDFVVVLENEADCETRAVRKIRSHRLPIDIPDYIRRANAYLASYAVAYSHRVWIPQPYRNDALCALLPSDKILSAKSVIEGCADIPPPAEFLKLLATS